MKENQEEHGVFRSTAAGFDFSIVRDPAGKDVFGTCMVFFTHQKFVVPLEGVVRVTTGELLVNGTPFFVGDLVNVSGEVSFSTKAPFSIFTYLPKK